MLNANYWVIFLNYSLSTSTPTLRSKKAQCSKNNYYTAPGRENGIF